MRINCTGHKKDIQTVDQNGEIKSKDDDLEAASQPSTAPVHAATAYLPQHGRTRPEISRISFKTHNNQVEEHRRAGHRKGRKYLVSPSMGQQSAFALRVE
jgi:hypothetical protein